MDNIITSFFDNIKEKTSNPFFGTLIFVWLVRNWELVYTLFNFDSDCTLDDKKFFIRGYYFDKVLWLEILINIGIALGLMLLGYLLIIISRLFVNVTNHNIIPRMNEMTVSKLVVNRSSYQKVKNSRDEYFTKIEELGEVIIGLEQKNTILKNEQTELLNKQTDLIKNEKYYSEEAKEFKMNFDQTAVAYNKLKKENDENKNSLITYQMEYSELNSNLEELNKIFLAEFENIHSITGKEKNELLSKLPRIIRETFFRLIDENMHIPFFAITDSIISKESASYTVEFINRFIQLDLIRFINKDLNSANLYTTANIKITELGVIIRRLRFMQSDIKNFEKL